MENLDVVTPLDWMYVDCQIEDNMVSLEGY
jgi:hypothetical protein